MIPKSGTGFRKRSCSNNKLERAVNTVSENMHTAGIARRISVWLMVAGLLAAAMTPLRAADEYPSRPVRIVVPYGAGGIADVTMRLTARKMSESLGQQFIIDNRPGGGGVAGMKAVATSPPDGYTLSMIGG